MNLRNSLALLLTVLGCFISYASAQFRIVNGRAANITSSPYVVSLHYAGSYYCAGSLITMELVVTAAHCLKNYQANSINVVAGVSDVRETGQRRRVRRLFYPNAYNANTRTMDIGAIRVRRAFTPGPTVATIPLCSTALAAGTQMRVSGWGTTSEQSTTAVNELRTATIPLLRFQYCANRYRTAAMTLTRTMICAGRGQRDSCSGDSGAPGVVNGQLCTVVSFGLGCARANYPGVYTNVNNAMVRRFLNNVMNRVRNG